MAESRITLKVSELRKDIAEGLTRRDGDPGYDPAKGSIEKKYGLSKAEVTEIFKHPSLSGLRIGKPAKKAVTIVDDITDVEGPTKAATENESVDISDLPPNWPGVASNPSSEAVRSESL